MPSAPDRDVPKLQGRGHGMSSVMLRDPARRGSQPWHDAVMDEQLRHRVKERIFQMFQKRRAGQDPGTLLEFAAKLERVLYKMAPSKEEYLDENTIEQRLHIAAHNMHRDKHGSGDHHPDPQDALLAPPNGVKQAPGSHGVMPTPGMRGAGMVPTPGVGASGGMVPTPGGGRLGRGVLGGTMPTPGVGPSRLMMGSATGAGGMIPTPGVRSGSVSSVPSTSAPLGPGMQRAGSFGGIAPQGSLHPAGWDAPASSGVPAGALKRSSSGVGAGGLGMIPTPGTAVGAGTSGMIPTPGGGGGVSGMIPTPGSVGMLPMSSGVGMIPTPGGGGTSGMIPTPGGGGSQSLMSNGAPVMLRSSRGTLPPATAAKGHIPVPSMDAVGKSEGGARGAAAGTSSAPGSASFGWQGMMVPAGGGAGGPGGMVPIGSQADAARSSQLSSAVAQVSSAVAQGRGQGPQSGPPTQMDMEKKKEYIKKQQQWLLFLRHCAKCDKPVGQCQYGQNCVTAKNLWNHITQCRKQNCQYPRCIQSRELLRHHSKCSNTQCPICMPVRAHVEKMRRSEGGKGQQAGGSQGSAAHHSWVPGQLKHDAVEAAGVRGPDGAGRKRPAEVDLEEEMAKRRKLMSSSVLGTSLLEFFDAEMLSTHIASLRSADPMKTNLVLGLKQIDPSPDICKSCGEGKRTFEPPTVFCFSCGTRVKRNQVMFVAPAQAATVDNQRPVLCNGCFTQQRGECIHLEGINKVPKALFDKKKNEEDAEEPWVQCDVCEQWIHQVCGMFNKGRNKGEVPYLCPECLKQGLKEKKRTPGSERSRSFLTAKDLPRCKMSDFIEARLSKTLAKDKEERGRLMDLPPDKVPGADGLVVRVVQSGDKRSEVKSRFAEHFCATHGYPRQFDYRQKVLVLFQRIEGVDVLLFCMYVHEYNAEQSQPNQRVVYLSYLDSIKYLRPEMEACSKQGMSVRTLVYHELLEAYLDWAKMRGFTSLYIWACPPMNGDDYIMHCHPSRQKTPKADKLREWYLRMLRSCYEGGSVFSVTNLCDLYFAGGKEHRLEKASMTHLPYFEGDYWPGEAEALMDQLGAEGSGGSQKGQKGRKGHKGKRGQGPATTDTQLMARLGANMSSMRLDFIVAHLVPSCSFCRKYHSGADYWCVPDRIALPATPSGLTSSPQALRNAFNLCQDCYLAERTRIENQGVLPADMAGLKSIPPGIDLNDLVRMHAPALADTSDPDPEMPCEFFDSRQSFLGLCQGNHYQFDTLRRAKHSSMMVLYHVHNPEEPAWVSTCNACHGEMEPGTGWRCTVCKDFDMCEMCYRTCGHVHSMRPNQRGGGDPANDEEQRKRTERLMTTLRLIEHAAACKDPECPEKLCRKITKLFAHAHQCEAQGQLLNCQICRRLLQLVHMHARRCTRLDCPVPKCREFRQMVQRRNAHAEKQRRAAYRQIAAGGDGQ